MKIKTEIKICRPSTPALSNENLILLQGPTKVNEWENSIALKFHDLIKNPWRSVLPRSQRLSTYFLVAVVFLVGSRTISSIVSRPEAIFTTQPFVRLSQEQFLWLLDSSVRWLIINLVTKWFRMLGINGEEEQGTGIICGNFCSSGPPDDDEYFSP